jgi:hypothetical protein
MARPLKFQSPEELQQKVDAFFDYCKKEEQNPIVEGLCLFLECDKQTILNYEEKDGYADILENAKLRIANHVMGRAMDGKINPTIAIWVSKNHYGYKDTSDVNNNHTFAQMGTIKNGKASLSFDVGD